MSLFPPGTHLQLSVSLTLRSLVAFLLGVTATGRFASAQCPLPDGLDGNPCCTLVSEEVPHFPRVAQPTVGICWKDCALEATQAYTAVWTPLKVLPASGADCGYRLVRFDLVNATGATTWTGTLRQLYARTWLETTPAGATLQVWRFLVNGDLRSNSVLPLVPCPAPSCAPAFGNRVHYTGYIDYVQECGAAAPSTQIAWMLNHACDRFSHINGFPRAGVFHPERSYSLVGPSTDFLPSPVGPVEVTPMASFEGMRRLRHPPAGSSGPILCEAEETPLARFNPLGVGCICFDTPPLFTPLYTAEVTVTGACGTNLVASGGPILPGYISMSIGTWSNPAVYPGNESLRWSMADYLDSDPCQTVQTRKVFYGVTTFSGFPATQLLASGPGGALPHIFVDQASAVARTGGTLVNVSSLADQLIHLNW